MIWGKRNLRKIAKEAVIQGDHQHKIVVFYSALIAEARKEFNEDNLVTLNDFLRECHEEALAAVGYPNGKMSWCDNSKRTI